MDYKRVSAVVYRFENTKADHLRNIRVHYTDVDNNGSVSNTEVQDWNDYYSYGMEHFGTNTGTGYRYKFNGIERIDGYVDFASYRGLDPLSGRWWHRAFGIKFLHNQPYFRDLGGKGALYSGRSAFENPHSLSAF